MELINLSGKTNFFEKRVGEYQKAGVMTKQHASANVSSSPQLDSNGVATGNTAGGAGTTGAGGLFSFTDEF